MNENDFAGSGSSERARQVYSEVYVDYPTDEFRLGRVNSHNLVRDAKHLVFILARYKFVAKMLHRFDTVLEVGCQEGLGSMIVAQSVQRLIATDFYKPHIDSCLDRIGNRVPNIEFRAHDIIGAPVEGTSDGAFALDVLEHIDPSQEALFMGNLVKSLSAHGVLIIGTPSLESQAYASAGSKAGHINCKSGEQLRTLCQQYFQQVFMFGMNDEVLHTGFLPMAHYLFALCSAPRR